MVSKNLSVCQSVCLWSTLTPIIPLLNGLLKILLTAIFNLKCMVPRRGRSTWLEEQMSGLLIPRPKAHDALQIKTRSTLPFNVYL